MPDLDVKLKNGDTELDATGALVMITGEEELVQRAMLCLTSRKGGFIYDKNFGLELYTEIDSERGLRILEARMREAVMSIDGLTLNLLSARVDENGRLTAQTEFVYKNKTIKRSVILSENL